MGERVAVGVADPKVVDREGCDILNRLLCTLFLRRAMMKLRPTTRAKPPTVAPTPIPALAAVDKAGVWAGTLEGADALVPKLG